MEAKVTAVKNSAQKKAVAKKTKPARVSAGKAARDDGVWTRLGIVVVILLAVALLFMVMSQYL
jgi:hypothetical protein